MKIYKSFDIRIINFTCGFTFQENINKILANVHFTNNTVSTSWAGSATLEIEDLRLMTLH